MTYLRQIAVKDGTLAFLCRNLSIRSPLERPAVRDRGHWSVVTNAGPNEIGRILGNAAFLDYVAEMSISWWQPLFVPDPLHLVPLVPSILLLVPHLLHLRS